MAAVLHDEWQRSQPDAAVRLSRAAVGTAPKAWRFVGEMQEIAASFEAVGLTSAFHDRAAALYELLAEFKDASPDHETVLAALGESGGRSRHRLSLAMVHHSGRVAHALANADVGPGAIGRRTIRIHAGHDACGAHM